MANVNLKTDFKNGETLFAYQLNNNFKAIEEALKAMNAIVWQDNADKVVTFRGTTEELMNREIIDGQILYDTTTGESYIDYEGKRISTGSGNAIHIGDTEPTNASTQLWINEGELAGVGSEVVNSLEGNEERMAPSVAAVNKGINASKFGITLYDNEDGSNEEITLDKKLTSDAKYIDILFRDDDSTYNSVRVYEPIGKTVDLHIIRINKSYHYRIKYSMISISNNTLTVSDYGVNTDGTLGTTNNIYITKVIAYIVEESEV